MWQSTSKLFKHQCRDLGSYTSRQFVDGNTNGTSYIVFMFNNLKMEQNDEFLGWIIITKGQVRLGMGAYAGAARHRVHLATVLLRPPSGHRPGRRQARHAHILQIGLHLTQPWSVWAPLGMDQPLGSRKQEANCGNFILSEWGSRQGDGTYKIFKNDPEIVWKYKSALWDTDSYLHSVHNIWNNYGTASSLNLWFHTWRNVQQTKPNDEPGLPRKLGFRPSVYL